MAYTLKGLAQSVKKVKSTARKQRKAASLKAQGTGAYGRLRGKRTGAGRAGAAMKNAYNPGAYKRMKRSGGKG